MSERKLKLFWKRVDAGETADEYQWQAHVGEMFYLVVCEPLEDEPLEGEQVQWTVHHPESGTELISDYVDNIEAGKLAAEDYAFAELVKAVASFGASIVDKGEQSK